MSETGSNAEVAALRRDVSFTPEGGRQYPLSVMYPLVRSYRPVAMTKA